MKKEHGINSRNIENINIQSNQQINKNIYDNLPDVMLVVISCDDGFEPQNDIIPTYVMKCDKTITYNSLREAEPMLRFIIKVYDKPLAKRYIFVHGHNTSWHYEPFTLLDRISKVIKMDYMYQQDFGGIFCHYINKDPIFGWWAKSYKFVSNYLHDKHYMNDDDPDINLLKKDDVLYPCCATFFITNNAIHKTSKSLYIRFLNGLIDFSISYTNKKINGYEPGKFAAMYAELYWPLFFNETHINFPPDCFNSTR